MSIVSYYILIFLPCMPSFIWTFIYSQKYKISSKYIKWQIIKFFILCLIWIIFKVVMTVFHAEYIVGGIFFGVLYVILTVMGILIGSLVYKSGKKF